MPIPTMAQFLADNPGSTKYDYFRIYGNPAGHVTRETVERRARIKEQKEILKQLAAEESRKFKGGITLGKTRIPPPEAGSYPLEDLARDTLRLARRYGKYASAYEQGLMEKLAQMSQSFTDIRPTPNKQVQGPSNAEPNEPVQAYRKKTKMQKYLGRK